MLQAKASIQVQRPTSEVFQAIIRSDRMNKYFIESSTGNLEEGKTVSWKFPEFEDVFPVVGKRIVENQYISFDWSGGQPNMIVEIELEAFQENSTVIRIKEGQMKNDEVGIQSAIGQSEGWANFLACLKAYLEYGINLRTGAFDFYKK